MSNLSDQIYREAAEISPTSASEAAHTIMLNQISWGAVFAGVAVALVLQVILNMVGLGVGLSTVDPVARDTPSAGALSAAAGIWLVVSGIVASAIAGYIAGRLSGKPSATTTAYHGLVAWALSTLVVVYLVSSAATGLFGGAVSTVSGALGGVGKTVSGSIQTAVQTAAPSLNNINDPMARIENQVRGSLGGQDPAALRDSTISALRSALSDDPAQQAAAVDKAADALSKAQGVPFDQAKAEVVNYQQQYKDMVVKAKEQARQAADTTAKTVSRGALFGALALLLGALAAFFAGHASAVNPVLTSRKR